MRVPLAREGAPFIAAPAAFALLAAGAGVLSGADLLLAAAAVLLAAAVLCALFFRDPERLPPDSEDAVVAPADGRVTAVTAAGDAGVRRVSIFLSLFDVHVNRSPAAGRVASVTYRPGEFRAAFRAEAAERNERNDLEMECGRGVLRVRQIAGVVARRIVCRAAPGERLRRGERFGLIRFGSRTEVLLPPNCRPTVRPGDRVRGGETVIALWS